MNIYVEKVYAGLKMVKKCGCWMTEHVRENIKVHFDLCLMKMSS